MKNPFYYLGVNPTVDLIILNPNNEILLIKRSAQSNACPSMLAFPGGFIDSLKQEGEYFNFDKEQPIEAALRELKEETNLDLPVHSQLILVGTYEGNQRDPRDNEISWSKTYAYFHRLDNEIYQQQKNKIRGMDDADEAMWISLEEAKKLILAFDHSLILKDSEPFFNV